MHIIDSIALISINETLFVQLISFLIFLFIINRIMFRPLNTVMDDRDQYIDDLKNTVLDAKEEMDMRMGQLRERESNAKNEAFNFKKELEESGNTKASEILGETMSEINTLKEKAESEINQQILSAQKSFKEESERIATLIMEKVLNRRLTS